MCLRFLDFRNFVSDNDLRVGLLLRVKEVGGLLQKTLINQTLDCPLHPLFPSPRLNCQGYFSVGPGFSGLDSSPTSSYTQYDAGARRNSCLCLQTGRMRNQLWCVSSSLQTPHTHGSLRRLQNTTGGETGEEKAEPRPCISESSWQGLSSISTPWAGVKGKQEPLRNMLSYGIESVIFSKRNNILSTLLHYLPFKNIHGLLLPISGKASTLPLVYITTHFHLIRNNF